MHTKNFSVTWDPGEIFHMGTKIKAAIIILVLVGIAILAGFFFQTHNIPVLEPKGMIALKEKRLLIIAVLLMLIVVVPVLFMTLFIAWRYREGNKKAKYTPEWGHSNLAEAIWWGVPCIIIICLATLVWKYSHELDPFKPIDPETKPLTVQVVALDWKWLFIYPEEGIATVNYLQIPENTPVYFELTADAPMNSFWIPQLSGQIFAMPGRRTKLYIIANEKGTYLGSPANINGKGFATMYFDVKATSKRDFYRWADRVKDRSQDLTMNEYQELVKPSENQPVKTYNLRVNHLFDKIVTKYMPEWEGK
ncbi:MAG: Cytochrome bo(3) ubiquinol oxidase subunit 2 [Chlamydiia bacterium]|nr:Cytochrome bo(3) ubiquinol oxidase subunit 2 [Chlamydiia bacterium]MCH9615324.1 Cytochrome bo(3) ubiquinol oxidase subunit 2 [Chlamydiia bacterium]MCH9628354.1 Cytochrome bo(3) ubiquinol oxidase subunit 2 [Chlamydiia bacterium]